MWIVAVDIDYYPYIETFETYEEAKNYFDGCKMEPGDKIYIAEVNEQKFRDDLATDRMKLKMKPKEG